MPLTRSTSNRLVEHWLDALTSCCRNDKQSSDTAGGVCVRRNYVETGAGDQDVGDETEDTMPLTHTHTHTHYRHTVVGRNARMESFGGCAKTACPTFARGEHEDAMPLMHSMCSRSRKEVTDVCQNRTSDRCDHASRNRLTTEHKQFCTRTRRLG